MVSSNTIVFSTTAAVNSKNKGPKGPVIPPNYCSNSTTNNKNKGPKGPVIPLSY